MYLLQFEGQFVDLQQKVLQWVFGGSLEEQA